jgi:hypothetical protein
MPELDQVAFYCSNLEQSNKLKAQFGLLNEPWIIDTVTGQSVVAGSTQKVENVAELQFNYSLGIELEILRYISGPHWHERVNPLFNSNYAFASHIGHHLKPDELFPDMLGAPLVQETFTQSHTSSFLTDPDSPGYGRKYHYRIHELSPGTYLKFIKRIEPAK